MIKQSVRTLRTFQVFRAAHELNTGEQGDTARQQHREATQIHISLPAGLRRRRVPSETQVEKRGRHVSENPRHLIPADDQGRHDKRTRFAFHDSRRHKIVILIRKE